MKSLKFSVIGIVFFVSISARAATSTECLDWETKLKNITDQTAESNIPLVLKAGKSPQELLKLISEYPDQIQESIYQKKDEKIQSTLQRIYSLSHCSALKYFDASKSLIRNPKNSALIKKEVLKDLFSKIEMSKNHEIPLIHLMIEIAIDGRIF